MLHKVVDLQEVLEMLCTCGQWPVFRTIWEKFFLHLADFLHTFIFRSSEQLFYRAQALCHFRCGGTNTARRIHPQTTRYKVFREKSNELFKENNMI